MGLVRISCGLTVERQYRSVLTIGPFRPPILVVHHAPTESPVADPLGHPIRREVTGFHARVVQHECDHLLGILYPMRMRDLSRFGYTDIIFPDSAPDEE